jgi:predicted site-specific integrase-resolvase
VIVAELLSHARRPLVNIVQACAIAKVSRRTIYYWMDLGRVEYVYTAGGRRLIYADTLLREPEDFN